MRISRDGCALCASTWGDVWEEVEGERLFFCCDLCARQFRAIVQLVHDRTGWDRIEALDISGSRVGRTVTAEGEGATYRFSLAFTPLGDPRAFRELRAT